MDDLRLRDGLVGKWMPPSGDQIDYWLAQQGILVSSELLASLGYLVRDDFAGPRAFSPGMHGGPWYGLPEGRSVGRLIKVARLLDSLTWLVSDVDGRDPELMTHLQDVLSQVPDE